MELKRVIPISCLSNPSRIGKENREKEKESTNTAKHTSWLTPYLELHEVQCGAHLGGRTLPQRII